MCVCVCVCVLLDLPAVCDDNLFDHTTIMASKGLHLEDYFHALLHLAKDDMLAIQPEKQKGREKYIIKAILTR